MLPYGFSCRLDLSYSFGILIHDKPEWRNWQTRATQTRVPLRIVGSIPTFGTELKTDPFLWIGFLFLLQFESLISLLIERFLSPEYLVR